MSDVRPLPVVKILYTNWRGETRWREVAPVCMHFGATDWHPEPQWLMAAFDLGKSAFRDFAMKDVSRWGKDGPAPPTKKCPCCDSDPATEYHHE
jgi:hypothetical protein